MKYSLDGGETWLDAPYGIRVATDVETADEQQAELFLNLTHEGLILDVWAEENLGTQSMTYDEIAEQLTN